MRKFMAMSLAAAMAMSMMAVPAMAESETETEEETREEIDLDALGEVNLRFSWWGGDERNEKTLQVIEQFEALHPNIHIEGEYGGSDGYHDKLATQLAGGTAADIVQVDPETFPTYVDNGDYFVDLQDYNIDMSNFEEGYIHQQINGYYDERQLGLPTGIAGPAIVVNKDLAEELGIDMVIEDMKWEDWIELGKKVREQSEDTYLICTNKEYIVNLVVLTYCKQLIGGNIFQDGKLMLTEEQLTKIFEYVKELYDNEVVPSAEYQASYVGDDIQSDANWLAGKYVACFSYISTVDVMVAGNPEPTYYAGSLPVEEGAEDGGWASNTPQVLAIPKSCEYPEAAAAFLDYFFNDDTALETLGATRSVPPTAKAREICAENGTLTQIVSDAADIAVAISGTPNDKISSSAESKTIFYDAVETIAYGEATPEEAAADVIDALSALEP